MGNSERGGNRVKLASDKFAESVMMLFRRGWDTKEIADLWIISESEVANTLARCRDDDARRKGLTECKPAATAAPLANRHGRGAKLVTLPSLALNTTYFAPPVLVRH
jgi:hypothetical protein